MRLNKEATKEYHRQWYQDNRERRIEQIQEYQKRVKAWIWELKKASRCERCSEDDPRCLDFHHKNPEQKKITIAAAVKNGWGKDRITAELLKCEVLCANCHRKEHAG